MSQINQSSSPIAPFTAGDLIVIVSCWRKKSIPSRNSARPARLEHFAAAAERCLGEPIAAIADIAKIVESIHRIDHSPKAFLLHRGEKINRIAASLQPGSGRQSGIESPLRSEPGFLGRVVNGAEEETGVDGPVCRLLGLRVQGALPQLRRRVACDRRGAARPTYRRSPAPEAERGPGKRTALRRPSLPTDRSIWEEIANRSAE